MKEWPYAKEPFDTKLFVLRFIKKIHWVLLGILTGALVIGGGYYLKKVVFGGPVEYDITTTYYIEYNNMDPVTGQMFNYTNDVTWGLWVVSDKFVDRTWQYALDAGFQPQKYHIEKSDLKGYFTADLPTDLRIPTSTVTTPYEEVTEILNDALQLAFLDFAQERTEMGSIEITNETPLAVADKDIRTGNAVILGILIGGFLGTLMVTGLLIWDESPVLPERFTYRYGIPAIGYIGKRTGEPSRECLTNLAYLFPKKGENICLVLGERSWGEKNLKKFPKEYFSKVIAMEELNEENYEKLRGAVGILLVVPAQGCKGNVIRHMLHELKVQDCICKGALLADADSRLIQLYRFGRKG